MTPEANIFVAGGRGLVGSAIVRHLQREGFRHVSRPTRAELDLRNQKATHEYFASTRPEYVLVAAAKVGGIGANWEYPADFIVENLQIETNVIEAAHKHGTKRLVFLGSNCIYPKFAPQPIREGYLLTGELEFTNRPYAIAKIAGIEMCWAYNRQHGTRFAAAMPVNIYGPGDHYDENTSHVLPALLHRAHQAKTNGASQLCVWGTGTPMREFLYSDDLAAACVTLLQLSDSDFDNTFAHADSPPIVNVGSGEELTVHDLAKLICEVVGFRGAVVQDVSKPDGTPRKLLDLSRMACTGWHAKTKLRDGLRLTYEDYQQRLARAEVARV